MHDDFVKFRASRYAKRPWDHADNPFGFAPEDPNPDKSSDISAHLPILEYFASQCDTITEFGTRYCCSTSALITGAGKRGKNTLVTSYDICTTPDIYYLIALERNGKLPCKWKFNQKDTVSSDFQIEPCDLLFVDTLHTEQHVKKELALHGHMVKKYLIFHDTFSQGLESMDRKGERGILYAIREYTKDSFNLIYNANFNHGLQVWERKPIQLIGV